MQTRILHTADTHIGYRQYHKPEREEDFREAFETVVSEAINENVDVVVHAGDMFNRSRPSISALSGLVTQLRRLQEADIEFYTIVGNHDGTRERQWPEFLEDLGLATYLGYEGVKIGSATLYGQDFVAEGQRSRLNYQFTPSDSAVNILVGHGLFTPFPHGNWDIEELLAKSTVPFDAVLLGDDHKPRIDEVDNIPITYSGSTERTAADQREKRGYNIVTVDDDAISIDHHKIETRDFHYIDLELEPEDGVEDVIQEVSSEQVPDDSVLIITITGDGKRIPTAEIERVGIRSGALVVRVNDRRGFEDEESEFREVSFADPDEAVKDRKQELLLSPIADELEQVARDLEGIPGSNLKDLTEEKVEGFIEERDLYEFREGNSVKKNEEETNDTTASTGSEDAGEQGTADGSDEEVQTEDGDSAQMRFEEL